MVTRLFPVRLQAGFTLVEMLVVIGIIVVISGVVLANNSRFGGMVQLQNLAYDIALSVRQSQVYGISVQRFGDAKTYAPAYGVHFQMNADPSVPTTFILFGDIVGEPNGVYNCPTPGASCELVESSTLQSGYVISGLYVTPGVDDAEIAVDSLDITYRRPEPEAYISRDGEVLGFDDEGQHISGEINNEARIELRSPREDYKSIIISVNGQISVE